jgi:hypothetical protein
MRSPDNSESNRKAIKAAVLPSNSGDASLRIDFVEQEPLRDLLDRMTDLEIVVPNWELGYPPQPCQIKVRGLRLRTERLRVMLDALERWLNLPIDQVVHNKFTGAFELASEGTYGRLLVRFGDRKDTISTLNQVVSVVTEGALRAECHFVTDQSGMRLFADELRSTIAPRE